MKLSQSFLIAMLGASVLALPAWADAAPPSPTQPAQARAPLTVNGKANPSASGSRDQAMQTDRNNRRAFMDARLAALHAGLELTGPQQPLWDPVEGALRDLVKARHAMRDLRREDLEPTARLKQRGERMVAMGQAIGKLADAAGPLLGSLTAEQKGRLPALLHGVGPHRLVKQAFAIEDGRGWGREGMRYGMHEGERDHMREGEGGWHHHRFADGDGGRDGGYDRRGMDRDGEGWHHHHGWDHEGRAGTGREEMDGGMDRERMGREDMNRDGMNHDGNDGRYDREGGLSRHDRHDSEDERVGG